MSNKFKLPEVIANNLRDVSNPDENIFCVYKYVKEHINNDDDLEQLYLAIIEFKPNAQIVAQYAQELYEKNRIAVAVSLMKNKQKYSGDDHSWKCFQSSEQDILQKPIKNTLTKTTESILKDLDKYGFSQIGNILHYMIDDVGPEITGEAISIIVEEEMHYNIQTCIKHICDKWLTDEEFYKTTKLTTNFIDTYINIYNNRLPNLKKHITRKADQNFDDAIAADAIKNGYSNYLVKDPEDWKNLKGPVGLAVQLCGCENFNQIIETEAQKEFKKHFLNIFFFTLKEIDNLPAFYKENLSAMLVTSIEALYHDDELCWGLEKEEGVLTHPLGALLDLEYGLDFNAYISEDQVPLYYGGEDLVLFGVNGISNVEYPVNYRQMAADLLVKISEKKYRSCKAILDKVSIISNPSCNKAVLALASEDTGNYSSSRVRKTVALNSGTPKVVIDKLIIDEHRWVREAAASHPTIDKQKIDELIKTGDRYLLKGLASNPNCTKTTKDNINSLIKDEEKYPLHWIETVESHKMDGVPVHPKRFWLELGSKATTAEWLYDKIYDGDGGYTDIDIDEWNEGEDLGEVGYAYYLWVDCPKYTNTNAAFFQVNVYLPNQEATDIYIVPLDDVISDLIEKNYREEIEDLFERYPWISDFIYEEDVYKK